MSNNCATDWVLQSDDKKLLEDLCEKLNELHKYPKVKQGIWFGKGWLKNLAEILRIPKSKNEKFFETNGFITPLFGLCPCRIMPGDDLSGIYFVTEIQKEKHVMRFATISEWDTPIWLVDYFRKMEDKNPGRFTFDYRATDVYETFHICRRGDLVGDVYEIIYENSYYYNKGQEKQFLENIANIIKVPVTPKMRKEAERLEFNTIIQLVKRYNRANPENRIKINIFA